MTEAQRTALALGDSKEYIEALLFYLGNRKPLEVFEETPGLLRKATATLSDEALRTPEKPGKWSVLDVAGHFADVEIVLGFRYRLALAQPGAPLPAIDQDAWVRRFDEGRPLEDTLEDFDNFRRTNLRLLRRTPKEQFQYYGQHEQRGKETLDQMVRLYAAHDLYHLGQIERIKAAINAENG